MAGERTIRQELAVNNAANDAAIEAKEAEITVAETALAALESQLAVLVAKQTAYANCLTAIDDVYPAE